VKEQSQIDAMREAVRGDIERSRARREAGDATQPEPPPIDLRARPDKLEFVRPRPAEAEPEPAPAVAEPLEEVVPEEPRRGLLSRLLRR
jgi:hypothetical protein